MILAASFTLTLLLLSLIRLMPGVISTAGVVQNLLLVSFLLGAGLGCAHRQADLKVRDHLLSMPFRLLIFTVLFQLIHIFGPKLTPFHWIERVWTGEAGHIPVNIIIALLFLAHAWAWLPGGRTLGAMLGRRRPGPGCAYLLAGAALGICCHAALCGLMVSPLAGTGLAAAVYLFSARMEGLPQKGMAAIVILWVAMISSAYFSQRGATWSPYYKVSASKDTGMLDLAGLPPAARNTLGFMNIEANNIDACFTVNLDPVVVSYLAKDHPLLGARLGELSGFIMLPYKSSGARRVLILGPGAGNHAAAALRAGASLVRAVAADPAIADLERKLHPERPFHDPRVKLVKGDPLAFADSSKRRFDLIVIPGLASYTQLSLLSFIRPDSLFYTRDGLQQTARLLSHNGTMAIYFPCRDCPESRRTFSMLKSIFRGQTRVWELVLLAERAFTVIVAGEGSSFIRPENPSAKDVTRSYLKKEPGLIPTFDRPFIYLYDFKSGAVYFLVISILPVISLILWLAAGRKRASLHARFFALGAAGLFLSVTLTMELALATGSTWAPSCAGMALFLVVPGLAGLLYLGGAGRVGPAVFSAAAFLVLLYAAGLAGLPREAALSRETVFFMKAGVSLPLLGLALWGYVLCMDSLPSAIGSVMTGAAAAGLLSYIVLATGFNFLYLLSAAALLAAYFARSK